MEWMWMDSMEMDKTSDPANRAFLRVRAIGLMARSTTLLSISMRPSSRNRHRPCQRDSA